MVTPDRLADDDRGGQGKHERPVTERGGRVEQHADRHEEDAGEHVAQGFHQRLDMARHAGLGNERAGEEGTECHGQALGLGKQGQRKAEPDAGDEQRLLAPESHQEAEEWRHDEKPDAHQRGDDEHQSPHRAQQCLADRAVARRQRRERGEHEDRDQVLGDEDAEHGLAQPLLDLQVGKGMRHDHGGGDGHQRAGEDAAGGPEVEGRRDLEAEREGEPDLDERDHPGGRDEPGQRRGS